MIFVWVTNAFEHSKDVNNSLRKQSCKLKLNKA